MAALYPQIKKILKILWTNDDIIFQEDIDSLQVEVAKLAGPWKKYPQAMELKAMIKEIDDSIDQDELFELQGLAGELAEIVAKEEGKMADLARSFPWLVWFSTQGESDNA